MNPAEIRTGIRSVQRAAGILRKADFAVSAQQYAILELIARNGGREIPARMAEELDVAPTVVTGFCDRLERTGLIERVADPVDRRKTWMTFTAPGREVYDRATATLEQAA